MANSKIKIDEDMCIGCGLCASTCHQGVIEIINGKAKLIHDEQCDNLGKCLPVCPVGAITFTGSVNTPTQSGCPGKNTKTIVHTTAASEKDTSQIVSNLQQWPVQIQLVPEKAPYFQNANLLIAADCTAYTYAYFHQDFMKNRITIIGCPKLDTVDYAKKLTAIIRDNPIKSVTVVRMEVPCCTGIETAVKTALTDSEKMIPWQVVTISTEGDVLDV